MNTSDEDLDARIIDLQWHQDKLIIPAGHTITEPLLHVQRLAEYTVAASVGLLALRV